MFRTPERLLFYIKRQKIFLFSTTYFYDLLHEDTGGYKRVKRVTGGYTRLQKGYKGLQGVKRAYRGLQGVTGAYNPCLYCLERLVF